MKPQLRFRFFESITKSWQVLFGEAMLFANGLSPRQLVSISHSCDKGKGVVTVWYWDPTPETESPRAEP